VLVRGTIEITELLGRASQIVCLLCLLCAAPIAHGQSSAQGFAQLLNPEISANLTLLGGYSTRDETADELHFQSGIALQELEVRLGASADPYFRLDVAVAGHAHEGDVAVEFEEGYVSTTSLPDLTLRLGKFRVNFGKANLQHAHAQRFIGAPRPLIHLFETVHLLGTGLSADWLLPLPFFVELNAQVVHAHWTGGAHDHSAEETDSEEESGEEAHGEEAHPFSYLLHLKSFFDLSDATSLEVGLSGLVQTDVEGHWQGAWGADLTLKWVPPECARYTSLEWMTEYMSMHPDGTSRDGLYTGIRYQFAQQWWLQGRGALTDLAGDSGPGGYRAEALFAFAPSERTAIRLQYAVDGEIGGHDAHDEHARVPAPVVTHQDEGPVHEVFLQLIVSIGAHPAHAY
jgi:hypothetical protein